MKRFADIYSERDQDAGWSVVQAATLLAEAKERRCSSLVIYAALELRMAIEQLIFTIIWIARGSIDDQTLQECRKKDGLFRVLDKTRCPEIAREFRRSGASKRVSHTAT